MNDRQQFSGWIYLVDQDPENDAPIVEAAAQLGLGYQRFNSLDEFCAQASPIRPACLCINQNQLPFGDSAQLTGYPLATLVLAHQPSVADVVHWMRAGAVAVLPTPLHGQTFRRWLEVALESDRVRHHQASQLQHLTDSYQRLSERRRAVLRHMIEGRASKWSAHQLDVSRRTIELDRADILVTFGTSNAIELAGRVGPWLDLLQQSSGELPHFAPSPATTSPATTSPATTSPAATSPAATSQAAAAPIPPHPRSLSAAAADYRRRWTLLST